MRRYARTLIIIVVLVTLAGLTLGFPALPFERGDDETPLGLSLGLDLRGGSHLVYRSSLKDPVTDEPIAPTEEQMESLKATIERRVNKSGLGEPIIQILGNDRLLIQLPGVRDAERAKTIIGETAQLSWKHRSFNVPRDLDEITQDDIVSVSAGSLPTNDVAAAPEVSEGMPGAAEEGDSEAVDDEPAAEDAADADPGTAAQEPESDNADAPEPADQQPEGEPDAEADAEAEAAAETTAAGQDVEGEDPGQEPEDEEEPPATLIVEFTDAGAEIFAVVADRLDQIYGESVGGLLGPLNRLQLSVLGDQPLQQTLSPTQIQRIDDSTRFSFDVDFSQVDTVDGQTRVEAAQALLGDNPTVKFVEIQGKADEDIGLTGDDLARAYASQQSTTGEPIVTVEFKEAGTRLFAELTRKLVNTNDQIAIFLDDEELISPTVQTAILGGTAIIQGNFTIQRVQDLALLLESGRLPVPITLDQERDVDAILGADSLRKSVAAGLVGLALVLVFMTLYYRVPGLVASVALIIYAGMVLAIFKLLPVTLTLSGVAALILSIGMAVDANILIFERMKEELRAGRTLLSAINIGFNRAWPAIRDGNVSTLITCGILFWFSDQLGVTAVQGFAAALAIGVMISMFSAIVISRTLLRAVAATPMARQLGMFVPFGGGELPQQRREPAAAAQRS